MRGVRITEKRVALVCAVVLVGVSVTAAWRQHYSQQQQEEIVIGREVESEDAPRVAEDAPAPSVAAEAEPPAAEPSSQPEAPQPAAEAPAPTEDRTAAPAADASANDYVYTSVAGSSYTEFARQAIASYASTAQLSLSPAAQLNAEVALVNEAGAPLLEIGEEVVIARTAVATVVQQQGEAQPAEASAQATPTTSHSEQVPVQNIAAEGSSYTQYVRQAIAAHSQRPASDAARIAAETYAVQAAGEPQLAVGQAVSVDTAAVQSAIERANQLSATELAAWQPYATTVAW